MKRLQRDQLSAYIYDAVMIIELGTNLKFTKAEEYPDGHALYFTGSLYKKDTQTWDDVVRFIKMQFAHNPGTRCTDEDTSDFEELVPNGNNEWIIYIAI